MIYLIIGWRILHVTTTGQACPNLPCDVVFDPEEWQAAWTGNTVANRHHKRLN
ncbi:MAG: IS4 family transposase [Methylococcales bacterium]|nr:IS4 family transposase [Methylococcales bacterium]